MRIRTVHSRDHLGRADFRPYVDGQHSILLEDGDGAYQGELVWRLANIGQGLAEISGFGIHDPVNRRQGWGTRLLETALEDIHAYMANCGIRPRMVYLLANAESEASMAFYRARGFRQLHSLPGLFAYGQAVVMARDLSPTDSPAPVTLERLASTDYPAPGDPDAAETPFGFQVMRRGQAILLAEPCPAARVNDLLAWVASQGICRITGYDPETSKLLWPHLHEAGWTRGGLLMMALREPPSIELNPDVEIEVIDPGRLAHAPSYRKLLTDDNALDHWRMEVDTEWRLGGEILVGWLDGRPAGRCGWHVKNGIARFRTVMTAEWARGRHVATTLIRYVQDHPVVRAQDALAIFSLPSDRGGAERLYERLGFRTVGFRWALRRNDPE